MFMILWTYRAAFGTFAFFGATVLLLALGMFMLKRGVYTHRLPLRRVAFVFLFIGVFKACMLDVRVAKHYLICDSEILPLPCTPTALMAVDFAGMLAFLVACVLLFRAFALWLPERAIEPLSPEAAHVRLWANLSLWSIIATIVWLAAPWVGFLTVGSVPRIFTAVPWQAFAALNTALLLKGFWQAEGCAWRRKEAGKKDRHLQQTWTARDTLWLNVFLYVLALMLCYVSADVLAVR
jgi:hypothetical protein